MARRELDFLDKSKSEHPLVPYLYLIRAVIRKYFNSVENVRGMVSAGYIGLEKAYAKYRKDPEVKFEAIAAYYIRMALIEEHRSYQYFSHNTVVKDGVTMEEPSENIACHNREYDKILADVSLDRLFRLSRVSQREGQALVQFHIEEWTWPEVGDWFEISPQAACQYCRRGMDKLKSVVAS